MIRIAITPAAFEAISATLPLGSVGFEREPDAGLARIEGAPPRCDLHHIVTAQAVVTENLKAFIARG